MAKYMVEIKSVADLAGIEIVDTRETTPTTDGSSAFHDYETAVENPVVVSATLYVMNPDDNDWQVKRSYTKPEENAVSDSVESAMSHVMQAMQKTDDAVLMAELADIFHKLATVNMDLVNTMHEENEEENNGKPNNLVSLKSLGVPANFFVETNRRVEYFATNDAARLFIDTHCSHVRGSFEYVVYTNVR